MKSCAIIPAGGIGKRIGTNIPKQFIEMNEIPIVIWTLRAFEMVDEVEGIIIPVHSEWYTYMKELIEKYNIKKVKDIVIGGLERQDSVFNALNTKSAEESEIILVHDAVRPFIQPELIKTVIETAEETGAAIPAIRPKDTIKETSPQGRVVKTLNRSNLRIIQTPQGYWFDILFQAYSKAAKVNYRGTDSASLVEFIGYKVSVVEGDERNIKITNPFDLSVGRLILQEQNQI